jgi:hypothetical protein
MNKSIVMNETCIDNIVTKIRNLSYYEMITQKTFESRDKIYYILWETTSYHDQIFENSINRNKHQLKLSKDFLDNHNKFHESL